jgi:hypothetical protein
MSDQLGRPEGKLYERGVTREISRKIRSRVTRVVKAATKGDSDGHIPVRGGIGDFGISGFLRPGR